VRRSAAFIGCALAGLVWAVAAAGHEGTPGTGFQSRVSLIRPLVPGLLVEVLGGDELLSVRNWSGKTVVLRGVDGRPFLRFSGDVVSRNEGAGWRVVGRGTSHVWHDPRIHATGPPPDREGLVRNWRIRGSADGSPFAIVGFLGYRPPPGAEGDCDAGLPAWAIVLAGAGGALVVAAALALPLRRREGENERRETATER
jgi:hypothetical protein